MSPTARTLAECKRRGWIAQVVEQTIPRTFIKRDLFGVIDIIAVEPSRSLTGGMVCDLVVPGRIIGIQATSGTNHAARVAKAKAEPRTAHWLGAGGVLEIWSWSKRGGKGKRKLWVLREEAVVL